jgi:hypothetical protein
MMDNDPFVLGIVVGMAVTTLIVVVRDWLRDRDIMG